jgi:hypothetical protein
LGKTDVFESDDGWPVESPSDRWFSATLGVNFDEPVAKMDEFFEVAWKIR